MKRLVAALVVSAVVGLATGGWAEAAQSYTPRHGHHCRRGFKRVKRHHRIVCVKRRHRAPAAKVVKLHAHLDPSYTRDPLDPFKVTYAYSASATQEVAAATASVEEPAPLPSGVLAFYSDGMLECAVNVGGSVTGNECPVHYQALGEHRVTTIYSSGEESATATEVEQIEPLASTTTTSMSYLPSEPREYDWAKKWWRIGTLSVDAGVEPSGSATISWCRPGCGSGSLPGVIGDPLAFNVSGTLQLPVWAKPAAPLAEWESGTKPCDPLETFSEVGIESPDHGTTWSPASPIELGEGRLYAAFSGSGYTSSQGDVALRFSPATCTAE